MSIVNRAKSLLEQTGQAPGMYATRREAYVAHVCGIMILLDAEFDVQEFYGKHLEKYGSMLKGVDKEVTKEWGREVVDDALAKLAAFHAGAQCRADFDGLHGHNEPCYYCKKPCNSLTGNPSQWPIPLCHADDPGRVKYHHIGCVSERLRERDEAQALAASVALDLHQAYYKEDAKSLLDIVVAARKRLLGVEE